MEAGAPVVAVTWDQANPFAFSLVSAFASQPPKDLSIVVPGLDAPAGNLLADGVIPALNRAELVVIVWSATDPLWVAFQAGMARGMGKPTVVVAPTQTDADAAHGAPMRVTVTPGPSELSARVVTASRKAPAAPNVDEDAHVLLCPQELPDDRTLLRELERAAADYTYRLIGPRGSRAHVAADVMWVITPYSADASSGAWMNLDPNVGNAFEAGRSVGGTLAATGAMATLSIMRVGAVRPIAALEHLTRTVADVAAAVEAVGGAAPDRRTVLRKVVLRNIKCFENLEVNLSSDSPLGGAWTCLAGVNGAGKSTVLQALAVALLGRRRAVELGIERLARMVRRPTVEQMARATRTSSNNDAEIRVTVLDGGVERELVVPLGIIGVDERRLRSYTELSAMEQLWDRLAEMVVVAYGATRNISDVRDRASGSMSLPARRQLTLFDPLSQIASAETLLDGGPAARPVLETLGRLVSRVLDSPDQPFECVVSVDNRLVFVREGTELSALDLPDGFRSVLALLADIASGWHEQHPDPAGAEPEDITGIVLVDELDLHLHASLQRLIVPRLRAALPNVQFVVTTHSPLVAGSFDRGELVLLDRTQPDGIRTLDRQILGFTADEVYHWLLDTRPFSEAGQEQLRSAGADATVLLYQSPDRNEDEASELIAKQGELLEKLRAVKR